MTEIITNNLKELSERILRGIASVEELAAEKIENVIAIKRDSVPHWRTAAINDPEKGERGRSFRFIASDETADRAGDIIRVSGWDFKNFKKNPVALWGHDASSLPIGRVFDFEKGAKRDNTPALFESIEYATAEMNPEADLIYRLVDGGFIKAVSVGFIPTKSSYPDTPEKREAAGLGAYGVLYEKQEQIELSQCSIPANPNALMSAAKSFAQSGAVSEKTVSRLFDALGLPAKTQIVVPQLPKEDKTEEVAQHPTTLDVAALFGEMKSELLAEVRLQTQKIEALEKSVKIMRRKLASQAVNKNRSSVPEAPSATLDQHAECHTQPKSYDELFSESFESRLRAALERGEVAGGNKN
jgi:HK97 family phage prohead protease